MLECGPRYGYIMNYTFVYERFVFFQNGNIKLIDRKKNFFKLSQGEFIAVEKLETAYIKSDFVSQLYVYGDSSRSYLVAIIVPEKDYLESWRLKNGIRGNWQ